ncbi:hypothetical protein IQ268_03370 [Oculatella sp. LEGE 06141]|uniref:hypothetical protein n=1 Tax=Oculatella sp. LEGE 06141 TaxID=1828648 RepID=UPI00187F47F4|nr:hypothetical protein [Oculatella sp. LEGE 06141]MBE9177617.1 hypothetical protein [Oculatella sp. LEGE 06141]
MSEIPRQLDPAELHEWQLRIAAANLHNILCHCRRCDREWVASTQEACCCGSTSVEHISCWQFPDD